MLKKLGSNLLYLVLKSVDRYNDYNLDGYVIHPDYLVVIIECIEEASEEGLKEIKHEIKTELSEGDYLNNKDFEENLEQYFDEVSVIGNIRDCNLYKIISECYSELKAEDN